MSLTRLLAILVGASLVWPAVADARKKKADDEEEPADEEEASADDSEDEGGATTAEDEDEEEEAKPKKKKKKGDEPADEEDAEAKPFVKQNLSGHDMGTTKKENMFEKDRFFVDKVDTDKTEKGTLVQGSLSSSSLFFTESGGNYAMNEQGRNDARFSRMYTELRLQTDFRHIGASRWDARIDARARVINQPDSASALSQDPLRVQSGFNGTNEYDVRELWLFRSGKRSDIFFGRQFIPDLGGVKFDGLRVDYAKSQKMTLIGFGGLYPLRGSRSITTDYTPLKDNEFNSAGRFVGAGGFGGAYRTQSAYGAIGGVVLAPFSKEQPRVFVTSTGYLRSGSTLDFYHFVLVDLYGSQIDTIGLTNVSLGLNYKPSPRLRLTAAVNRVDVDTLAVQANAFLNEPSAGGTLIENETYFRRLATNTARAGLSAGLGQFQRFEISVAATYRSRDGISIPVAGGMTSVPLEATRGVEVYGSIVDRRSIKDMRLGIDATRTIGLGGDNTIAFMRSNITAVRVFGARELANGHGEWEAEVAFSQARDSASSTSCLPSELTPIPVPSCYGSSKGSMLSAGGNLYYRINRDWLAFGTLFLTRQTLDSYGNDVTMPPKADPAVIGVTAFGRIAYRF